MVLAMLTPDKTCEKVPKVHLERATDQLQARFGPLGGTKKGGYRIWLVAPASLLAGDAPKHVAELARTPAADDPARQAGD
jgi:hypothetical protein